MPDARALATREALLRARAGGAFGRRATVVRRDEGHAPQRVGDGPERRPPRARKLACHASRASLRRRVPRELPRRHDPLPRRRRAVLGWHRPRHRGVRPRNGAIRPAVLERVGQSAAYLCREILDRRPSLPMVLASRSE